MNQAESTPFVFVREEPVAADLAMVFGASNEADMHRRTRRGVELWQQRFVPRLLVTGGGVLAQLRPEAQRMAEIARDLGVPDANLLVEDKSANTFQNIDFSRELLESQGLLDQVQTVLLVSSEWHMRRVLLTARKRFPAEIHFVCCPTLEGCSRENWMQSAQYRWEVDNEALLLEALLESGAI